MFLFLPSHKLVNTDDISTADLRVEQKPDAEQPTLTGLTLYMKGGRTFTLPAEDAGQVVRQIEADNRARQLQNDVLEQHATAAALKNNRNLLV